MLHVDEEYERAEGKRDSLNNLLSIGASR